jgi:long-chain acyl-CoA synthetase
MVVGQDQKHLGVLVVPSVGGFGSVGITEADVSFLAVRPEVRKLLQSEIRRLICGETGFKPFERVAALELIGKSFEVGDELTMTFKLRRHIITEKYSDQIAAMFS